MNLKNKLLIDFINSQGAIFDGFNEFVVLAENRNALEIVEKYLRDTTHKVCLILGTPGSGKTHLAAFAIKKSGLKAVQLSFDALVSYGLLEAVSPREIDCVELSKYFECIFIENIDLNVLNEEWAEWLILTELMAANGCKIILTGSRASENFKKRSIVAKIDDASDGRYRLACHFFLLKYGREPREDAEVSLCYNAASEPTFRRVRRSCVQK